MKLDQKESDFLFNEDTQDSSHHCSREALID